MLGSNSRRVLRIPLKITMFKGEGIYFVCNAIDDEEARREDAAPIGHWTDSLISI